MQTMKRDEPANRPQGSPERGAPTTYAAHAFRKNLTVKVLVKSTSESEEREHGYGHGV